MGNRAGVLRSAGKAVAGLALVVAVASCSAPATSSGGAAAAGPKALESAVEYDGPEASLPTSLPPIKTTGQPVTVGIACAACQIAGVKLQADETAKTIEGLGGKVITLDAGGDAQKQLNQFRQLVAQGVNAVIIQPLVETAMAPVFADAAAKGVSVITVGAPGDTTKPLQPGVVSNVTFGLDRAAFQKAQYFASTLPKGAQFGLIGFGVPSEGISYGVERSRYWAEKFGLTFAQQVDISELTVTAGQTAGTAMLQRNPEIRAVMSFSDEAASGVFTAARLLNKPDVMVCGNDFDKLGQAVVASGNGSCDIRWDFEKLGALSAQAAYMAATHQGPIPPMMTSGGGVLVNPANVKDVPVVG